MAEPVFVTGQQIGLLGGPLYTTYKVLGAAALSREKNGQGVYWLETNDADFTEINHFTYLDKENHLKTLRWDKNTGGLSCGFVPVDEKLTEILNAFFDDLTQTEWTEALRELVLSCYRPGEPLGKASLRLASALYKNLGIQIFDPSEKEFLQFIRPILEKEIDCTKTGEQCNAFLRINGKRLALFKTESGTVFRDKHPANPEDGDLLPNLKTRSVCQDAYFKTDTYVAGPGEVAYLKELFPWYERHRVKPARVQQRMSAILIEPRTRRLLNKCALTVREVTGKSRDSLVKTVRLRESGVDLSEIEKQLYREAESFLNRIEKLGINRKTVRKPLTPALKAALGQKRVELNAALGKIPEQAGELSDRLLPGGQPQERALNLFYFMNRYGGLNFVQWLGQQHRFESQILEVGRA